MIAKSYLIVLFLNLFKERLISTYFLSCRSKNEHIFISDILQNFNIQRLFIIQHKTPIN